MTNTVSVETLSSSNDSIAGARKDAETSASRPPCKTLEASKMTRFQALWYHFQFLLFPRGILATFFYGCFLTPYVLMTRLFRIWRDVPPSWGILLELAVKIFRFPMISNHWLVVRKHMSLYDAAMKAAIWFMGYRVEHVKRKTPPSIPDTVSYVQGTWILERKDMLPDSFSSQWEDRIVVFWIHGGGFSVGTSLSMASGHVEVMQQFAKKRAQSALPLTYFVAHYPLAPEHQFPSQVDGVLAAYLWLTQQVGAKRIILGGDSAGANLAISLHKKLRTSESLKDVPLPLSMALISPWLDVSNSHSPPHEQEQLANRSDGLTRFVLDMWSQAVTPRGMSARDPQLSPFFDLEPIPVPDGGIWLNYGDGEIFAPVIRDWVKSIQRQPDVQKKLQVVCGSDMPHNYSLMLHVLPGANSKPAKQALASLAEFILKSSS